MQTEKQREMALTTMAVADSVQLIRIMYSMYTMYVGHVCLYVWMSVGRVCAVSVHR